MFIIDEEILKNLSWKYFENSLNINLLFQYIRTKWYDWYDNISNEFDSRSSGMGLNTLARTCLLPGYIGYFLVPIFICTRFISIISPLLYLIWYFTNDNHDNVNAFLCLPIILTIVYYIIILIGT